MSIRRSLALVVLGLSVASYFLVVPWEWSIDTPLTWDESSHYFGATQIADGLRYLDRTMLRQALRGRDVYPPGHSVVLGLWFLIFGKSMAAWLSFGLLAFVGTTALLLRTGLLAGLLFVVSSPMLRGLAPSLMLEPVALFFFALTVVLFPQPRDRGIPYWRYAAFSGAAAATILTKYNIGLPILPAAIVAALLTRDRKVIIGTTTACVLAVGMLAAFLKWQDEGLRSFREFVINRSDSAEKSPFERISWYANEYVNLYTGSALLAVAVVGVAIAGGLWILLREKPWAKGITSGRLAYVLAVIVITLASYSVHEFLNRRNLALPAIALLIAAGIVVEQLSMRRQLAAIGVFAVICLITALTAEQSTRTSIVEAKFYPPRNKELRVVSDAVANNLDPDKRIRVVGTFNEFSDPWVSILGARKAHIIASEDPYWGKPDRSRNTIDWSEKYAESVHGWHSDGFERVLALEVARGSMFDTRDYELWNKYKENLVRALRDSPDYRLTQRISFANGVTLSVFDAVGRN